MTTHTTHPARLPAAPPPLPPSATTSTAQHEPAGLAPALPPAFEAFCTLHRDSYLDYALAHLPHKPAHRLVCGVLGELATGWSAIVSNPNPTARAWRVLRTRVQATACAPVVLETCPAQQYDALVLHCRLGYSSSAAAVTMGLDPSKIRYLVLSSTPARRHAARHLDPRYIAPQAA